MTLRRYRKDRIPVIRNLTAAEVMVANPRSIGHRATVREAADFLRSNGIHTAPVIDEAGRPIGVMSQTDLLDYWGRRRDRLASLASGDEDAGHFGAQQGFADLTVTDIMTPVVFCVPQNASLASVISKTMALEVRCLFVTDEHGVLVGAISVFDLLRSVSQAEAPDGRARVAAMSSVVPVVAADALHQTDMYYAPT